MEGAREHIERKRRRRRALALLAFVLLPLLLAGGAWLFLQSRAGEALVRAQVLDAANAALAGRVELGGVELRGGHLVLTNLELFTPEGALVASIARVEADVDLGALARERLLLSAVRVQAPELWLKEDERGWNLSRAVAAKQASAPSAPSGPNGWLVEVKGLELFDGLFDLVQEDRRVTATKLGAQGDVRVRLDPLEVVSTLTLSTQVTAPLDERLDVTLTAGAERGPQVYGLTLTLGQTKARARVELPRLDVTVEELVAAPRELAAFVPGWPLLLPAYARGTLSPRQANLELKAGRGVVTLRAAFDPNAYRADLLSVEARSLDLHELIGAPLQSSLDVKLDGLLTDWRPQTLGGKLEANATWDGKGQRLATAALAATADTGTARLRALAVESPGLSLKARGSASLEQLSLFGTLTADDLSAVGRTLRTFAGVEVPGLAGEGKLHVSALGPVRGPAVKAAGKLTRLSVAGFSADALELNGDLPNLFKPLDAAVLLHARQLRFEDRSFDEVTLDFSTHGRELDLDLATRGLGDLQVHAVGKLDADTQGAELQLVELKSLESNWALQAPTHVTWAPRLKLAPFLLKDGVQSLGGALAMDRRSLDASLHVEHLDLSRLPRVLAPPSLSLAGTVEADVTASGKPSKPQVTGTVTVRGGRVRDVTGLDADVRAAWRDERATGTLTLASPIGALDGSFDLPVLAFLDEQPVEGTARLSAKDVSTAKLGQQLGRELPLEGLISGVLEVSGTGAKPLFRLTVEAPTLAVKREAGPLELTRVSLALSQTPREELAARLELSALGGTHEVTLDTPLTLASLRHSPPDREALLALPVTLGVEVRNLDVRKVKGVMEGEGLSSTELGQNGAGVSSSTERGQNGAEVSSSTELGQNGAEVSSSTERGQEGVSGALSVSGTLHGGLRAPTGQLVATFAQLSYPPLQRADGRVTLRTTEAGRTELTADVALAQKPALALTAAVAALPEKALAALLGEHGDAEAVVTALADVPLELRAVMQPFDLSLAVTKKEDAPTPGGFVSGTLEVDGTLEAPRARLLGSMRDLRFDRAALGSARFDLESSPTEQQFTVALGGQGRDDLKAKGTTGVDLRLSALRRGLAWRPAPVSVSLEGRNFDLAFLSGATDALRVVAGRLDLAGQVTGTLGAPRFEGDATLKDGRVALSGNGDYRNIQLRLHADEHRFEVERLELKSGAGTAQLVARALKQPSGVYLLTSEGSADRFPLVNDDQLLATATLTYSLEGDVSSALTDIRRLSLPRVVVELPEVKRKDLQDLERPRDVIVLRGGKRPARRLQPGPVEAGEPQRTGGGFALRAVLDAPRNIWVKSSDVNVELGLSDGFRVEHRDGTRLYGEGRVVQGQLSVIGREFTVQKGSEARFAGPASKPSVNVTALHVNAREQVKITVTVAGRGSDVTIKATSEPPMPESDIYAVLATGRRNLKTSGGAAFTPGQAASVVGQLAASQLKSVIAKKLPIDVFNFETSDNFEKVKLDVGKYLSDSVYLGGSVNIGARRERGENVWAGRLELQVTRSVSLEAYAGDALSFGADAMWSRDF